MKLAEWARASGVHPQTAYRWFRQGTMPVPARRLPSGTILVDTPGSPPSGRVVLYGRVSSHNQRADLERQVARLTTWATGQGLAVAEVVTEVGAGVNGKRPRLTRLLADPQATVIVVEHQDRLARFGVEHLEAALAAQGRRLLVVDPGESTDDLMRDLIDVLTEFCARAVRASWCPQPGAARGDRGKAVSRSARHEGG
jgi:putative resolvase